MFFLDITPLVLREGELELREELQSCRVEERGEKMKNLKMMEMEMETLKELLDRLRR